MEVANTIIQQIGRRALYMIGAKNLVGGNNCLSFKIMRNANGISGIRVTLDASDTYTVEFLKIRKYEVKVASQFEGVYFDQLRDLIESETGLFTSLGTMGR